MVSSTDESDLDDLPLLEWEDKAPKEVQQKSDEALTFAMCVVKIKDVYEKSNNILDNMVKLDVIQQLLRRYFQNEDSADVFEGFVRLISHLDKITTNLAKQMDLSLVKLALTIYSDFIQANPSLGERPVELTDKDLVLNALKLLASLKFKHAEKISKVFNLKNSSMTSIAVNLIKHIMSLDLLKAVQWMELLNLRDQFPFEHITAQLILDNYIGILDSFVGETEYRRRHLLQYLDRLVECHWKNRFSSLTEQEKQLISDPKKIIKLAIKRVELYKFKDELIPFIMIQRAYNALMFYHHSFQNGERSWNQFTEVALAPIGQSDEIRDRYFNLLCDRGMAEKALHLAHMLKISIDKYPSKLIYYCEQNPNLTDDIRKKVTQNAELKKRNEKIEEESVCQLDLDGRPIIVVNTLDLLAELIVILRNGEDKVIGIDAEWRPHFLNATEQISIMQIAVANAVYLVDILVLQEEVVLLETHWLNFFDALFCKQGVQKIGYDLRNDIRVMKSTFPFITKVFQTATGVICLYKLFCQVVLMPDASKSIFGTNPPKNLGLTDMTNFFMNIKLEKSERIGNWNLRPLRLEQKKYAALDAYCLIELYRRIVPLIESLPVTQQIALKECAVIKLHLEETVKKSLPMLIDGQIVRGQKEDEKDFISNIQKASAELVASTSSKVFKSIDDFCFVMDSMLFGLGKNLRKCGFDTRLIGNRDEILNFCRQPNNQDFIVLSTGKGHRILEGQLGPDRTLFVPVSTHTGAVPPSQLVKHVMHELNIAVRPGDIWSRCMECNQRAFLPIPMRIVQLIFYMNAIRADADWLGITEDDWNTCLKTVEHESRMAINITPEMHSGEEPLKDTSLLDEWEYYLYQDNEFIICETNRCNIDILNKLLLAPNCIPGPISIHVGLKYKKDSFDAPNQKFFICAECGRVQKNDNTNEEEEK